MDIGLLSKELLLKAVEDRLTPADLKIWREQGHLILHWLRNQFVKEVT